MYQGSGKSEICSYDNNLGHTLMMRSIDYNNSI